MDSLRLGPVITTGLKFFFCQIIFLLGTLFTGEILCAEMSVSGSDQAITVVADQPDVPDRTITVVAEQPDVPEWKVLWDKARENVRENQYPKASKLYEKILKEKPNIEEANWEYCKVLLKTENFSSAAKIIISLVEKDPLRIEYLLAAGMLTLQQKHYGSAVKYFGKVYELDPGGINSTAALAGLIDSLKGEGKYETVLPLLEQLHIRDPENVLRLHELARAAGSLGKLSKAKSYYTKLLNMGPVDDRILFQASKIFEDTNNAKDAVPLWQEYIRRNPHYLPFRQKLIDFYLARGDRMSALPHLLFIDNKAIEDDQRKLQIAEIYLHDGGRPDKALSYYEKYLLKNPDDQVVKSNVARIQSILANDFLSIVENDGAWLLWRDLMEVTPNRLGIYLEMAKLLEKKGKVKELLEILLIISDHKPHDDKINYKIAALYRQKKEYSRALYFLSKITASHNSSKKHFLLKGDIEELAGFEQKALASYSEGLKLDDADLILRKKCITKAGSLGLVKKIEVFFNTSPITHYSRKHLDFILNYFDQLSYNSLFGKWSEIYEYFLDIFKNDPETLSDLQFRRVDVLRQEGRVRSAEELLRKLSTFEQSKVEALFRLAMYAINDKDIQAFKIWYGAFEDKIEGYPSSELKTVLQRKKEILKIKILLATDDLQDAAHLIIALRKKILKEGHDSFYDSFVYQVEKELCWQYLDKNDYRECKAILENLQKNAQFDPELFVIFNIIKRESTKKTAAIPVQFDLFINKQPVISRLLQVVQVEVLHKEYTSAGEHLKILTDTMNNSLARRLLSAEISARRGDLNSAVNIYKTLYEQFPNEGYLLKKWVLSESKRGEYSNAVAVLLKSNQEFNKIDTAVDYSELSQDFEEVLIFARMLWGNRQQEKSLQVYKLLLNPPVIDLLEKKFEYKEIYSNYFNRDKSFLKTLRYLLQTKPEIVAELMAPSFLINNLGTESGKIVVDYYKLYSWQKLILNEYLARKAILQRKYIAAERNYKRLLEEEEENIEGLADLASIYDRFGQYRKEAQLYEVMKKSGVTSSELEDVIEKSSVKIRPHTGLESNFLTQKGRKSYIDLKNTNIGASLSFTPDLEKDIRFLYLHNTYSKKEDGESISGFFLESTGTIELLHDTDLLFSGQAERFDGRSGANFYYLIGLRSRLDDYISGHIEAYKKKVDDTLEAVISDVYNDGFEAGLSGETPVGLLFGGDYKHRYYSDGNSQDQFHVYSAYNIYGEDTQFSFQYDYQYLDNSESNREIKISDVGEREDDFYWKPDRYTEYRLTVHFEHLMKGQYESDGLKSYYSLDNSLGYEDYEDTQNIIYTGKFDIFLEMSPHFLLKGNFVFINSDEYENRSLHFSLLYRW